MRAFAVAVLLGVLAAVLFTGSASADHPIEQDGKHLLWAELMPGDVRSVEYSLCSYDPDGLPRHVDGDEYYPTEYQTGLNGWKLYMMTFTPMNPRLTKIAGDCDVMTANLRVAVQTDICQYACTLQSTSDQGGYKRILSSDVYVQTDVFPNMGEWKQWLIYHELGHVFGLDDHNPPTQCDGKILAEAGQHTGTATYQSFMLMQQYNAPDGYLAPCMPEPSAYERAAVACRVYEYQCHDVNILYWLQFGGGIYFCCAQDGPGYTSYAWLMMEVENTYKWDTPSRITISWWDECVPDPDFGMPECFYCSWGPVVRLLPGPSEPVLLGDEQKWMLYRMSFSCTSSGTIGVQIYTVRHFTICLRSTVGGDPLPQHDCIQKKIGWIVF